MIEIVICEDNQELLNLYQVMIQNEIDRNRTGDRILLATNNPQKVIDINDEVNNTFRMYLLDIEFSNSPVKGIELAKLIRKNDRIAKIIFISSHSDKVKLTVTSQVEAFDYIDKVDGIPNANQKIVDDYRKVCQYFNEYAASEIGMFEYHYGFDTHEVRKEDIEYFETIKGTKKVSMHTKDKIVNFESNLKLIHQEIPDLFQLNRSILINTNAISSIDKENNKLIFISNNYLDISYVKAIQLQFLFSRE